MPQDYRIPLELPIGTLARKIALGKNDNLKLNIVLKSSERCEALFRHLIQFQRSRPEDPQRKESETWLAHHLSRHRDLHDRYLQILELHSQDANWQKLGEHIDIILEAAKEQLLFEQMEREEEAAKAAQLSKRRGGRRKKPPPPEPLQEENVEIESVPRSSPVSSLHLIDHWQASKPDSPGVVKRESSPIESPISTPSHMSPQYQPSQLMLDLEQDIDDGLSDLAALSLVSQRPTSDVESPPKPSSVSSPVPLPLLQRKFRHIPI